MIREDSKQLLLSVFGIAILIVAVVGVSYAIFVFASNSRVENTIRTGGVSFQYLESDNVINIENALPVTDEVGKVQKDVFDFTVSSTIKGNVNVSYEIRAKSLDVSNPLDFRYVKMYLEKENNGFYETVLLPTVYHFDQKTTVPNSDVNLNSMLLYSDSFVGKSGKTITYYEKFRLRMWVNSNYKLDNVSKSFKVKLDVYASM